jgi:predicted acetyltransferase
MTINIEHADWKDILTIAKETSLIWSCGLTRDHYLDYLAMRMNHPWSRRHCQYIVARMNNKIVSSAKLYSLTYSAQNRHYKIAGLGALYTPKAYRNQGYASELIKSSISQLNSEYFDGIILYSDIESDFYEALGFAEIGGADFCIALPPTDFNSEINQPKTLDANLGCHHIQWLAQYYNRWLSTQSLGIERNTDYWSYKIRNENYLAKNSRLNWPSLKVFQANLDPNNRGYAIAEIDHPTLRVLEIVGTPTTNNFLWQQLVNYAGRLEIGAITGWEAAMLSLDPTIRLKPFGTIRLNHKPRELVIYERNRLKPMFLALNKTIDHWIDEFPSPLLELDYL